MEMMPTLEIERVERELEQVRKELVAKVGEAERYRLQVDGLRELVRRMEGGMAVLTRRLIDVTGQWERLEELVVELWGIIGKLYQEHFTMAAMAPKAYQALDKMEQKASDEALEEDNRNASRLIQEGW
jgi:hypothetical protein